MAESLPEPWLRGPLPHVPPQVMPVFFSFAQVREELGRYTQGLTNEQVWQRWDGLPSLGFHLKHIAGSVDRLTTYLAGGSLTGAQLQFLQAEPVNDVDLNGLLLLVERTLQNSEARLLTLAPETLFEARTVGRTHLPTTVFGLLVHLAEHTQRHLGQAITTIRMMKGARASSGS